MTRPRGSKREADEVSRHKKATEERKAAREEAMDWGEKSHGQPPGGQGPRHMSQSAGSKNGMAKLTEAQVAQIREDLGAGEFQRVIAARFGVTQAAISQIKTGKKWRTA